MFTASSGTSCSIVKPPPVVGSNNEVALGECNVPSACLERPYKLLEGVMSLN